MFAALDEIRDLLETAMTTSIKKYYVGKVDHNRVWQAYCPVLCVYPITTTLVTAKLGVQRDQYAYTIGIDVISNAYEDVSSSGVESTKNLLAQKTIIDLIEDRDADGTPKAATVLGTLRRNIKGTNFLFNNDIVIRYEETNISGTWYYRGTMELRATTKPTNRS